MARTVRIILLAALVAGVGSCDSLPVVQKNLEEGRLVPETAVASADFLNEYRHPLPPPRRGVADLAIALERGSVLAQGGTVLVQVGVSTLQPALKPVRIHALAFAPTDPAAPELNRLNHALGAIRRQAAALAGATLTLDLIQPVKDLNASEPAFLPAGRHGNLKDFMTALARQSFDGGDHHVVLLVGTYKGFADLPGLSGRERQDLVDLGRILAAKSLTLSVLSVGDKPDFGFLAQLAQAGRGSFSVATESIDYDAWIREDLRARRAETLTEVELAVHAKNGARLARVLAPAGLRHTPAELVHAVSGLRQGRQHVVLLELEIPPRTQSATNDALEVDLKYHVPSARRYYQARENIAIRYVDDRNLALRHANATIERSLLILQTQETLLSVAREIRDRRNYQAIALLTGQSRALQQAGEGRNDRELARDATILARYAERLYEFDGEWFKAAKIWNDLSWDSDRFRNRYQ
ncbi:MAG TPA: hypothetical protein VKE95_02170 [Burkholderiales bacterium]|nr:hypothetical protein [Burkholderiales bacterium]